MAKKDIGKIVLLFILVVFMLAITNSASKSSNVDPVFKSLIPNMISGITKEFLNGINLKIILVSVLIILILVSVKYLKTK